MRVVASAKLRETDDYTLTRYQKEPDAFPVIEYKCLASEIRLSWCWLIRDAMEAGNVSADKSGILQIDDTQGASCDLTVI